VNPELLLEELTETDMVIIPAVNGDKAAVVAQNQDLIAWIAAQYRRGAEVVSLCVGAFLLAETGLLDGLSCTTHWSAVDEFQNKYSRVEVISSEIVTERNGIYTSGGALSFWNLLLHLALKYADRETAIYLSKFFEIDFGRSGQSAFVIFGSQKQHSDETVRQAQGIIERDVEKKIQVAALGSELGIGERSLQRRFKNATGETLVSYIQRAKIEYAKRQIELGGKTVLEVMRLSGYEDPRAFRKAFTNLAGLTPTEYKAAFTQRRILPK
jgi:transcriptional regulator GlxA family with amidase domain